MSAWRDRFRNCLLALVGARSGISGIPWHCFAVVRIRIELVALADQLFDLAW